MNFTPVSVLGLTLGVTVMAGQALAQLSLPMKYFPDASINHPDNGEGTRVYVGARAETVDGKQIAQPTGAIYLAPNQGSVTGARFHRYATANCPVVDLARADERTAADLWSFQLNEVAKYKADIEFYNEESRKSRKECVLARKNRLPDADETCSYASTVADAIKDLGESLAPWTTQISELNAAAIVRLDTLGKQPGGFADATVSLYDDGLINNYKAANSDKTVAWVGTRDVTFSFTTAEEGITDTAENTLTMRTTLGFSLAGAPLPPGQLEGSASAKSAIASGGNVALGITLSRLGACDQQLIRSGVFFYKFDSFSYVRGTAKINKWAAYERIEKNSSKGGFFTTKSVHSLYEDLQGGQVHEVTVDGIPDGSDLATEKAKLEADILADLLAEMADAQNLKANPANVLGLPTPGQNGATVISDGLQKCPHIYCQAGAFVMKSLSAIFGGATSKSEAKSKFNVQVERKYTYSKKHDEAGAATAQVTWTL